MLTHLQREIAEIISNLESADGFALAGGAALILNGDIDRGTRDLDFFGLERTDVDRLLPEVEDALREGGLLVRRVREGT